MMHATAAFAEFIRQHCFRNDKTAATVMGAELECLALNAATLRPQPLFGRGGIIEQLRDGISATDWKQQINQHGIPRFHTAFGGVVTFEPGGQIEYSSPPFASGSLLLRDLELHAGMLERLLAPENVVLHYTGIDPFNSIDVVPLQLSSARYTNMTEYFACIGAAGERMMRQTAALQVNINAGPDAEKRWQFLNRLAPVLIALFANSRSYACRDSGYANYRAQTWRETDPLRTGVFNGSNPIEAYAQFALRAPDFLNPVAPGMYVPFEDHVRAHDEEMMAQHLTTLFPEVRPRGWLEIRSIDTQPIHALAAPLAFIAGLVFDDGANRSAIELLPDASESLLQEAGRYGVSAPALQPVLTDLVELALAGCTRLGQFLSSADLERASALLRLRVSDDAVSDAARTRPLHSQS